MPPRKASIVLVLAVVYVDMLGIGLAFPILPRLIQHFVRGNFSRASWIFGLIAAAYALALFVFAPILGALSDRFGRRPVILLALLGMGLSVAAIVVVVYGLVPQGWMVYPVMGLGLFGWTIAQPAVMGLMSRAIPPTEQGLLQGAVASVNSLTAMLGPPVWTSIFAYFVSEAAPAIVPGAAFYGSALVFVLALLVALQAKAFAPAPAAVREAA